MIISKNYLSPNKVSGEGLHRTLIQIKGIFMNLTQFKAELEKLLKTAAQSLSINELTQTLQEAQIKFVADNTTELEPKENVGKIRVFKDFDSYNDNRFSKPWIAKVTQWRVGKTPHLEFGRFVGEKGFAGQVEIKAVIGDLIKYGQKDYRGHKTINQFAVVEQGGLLTELTPIEAREYFEKTMLDKKV